MIMPSVRTFGGKNDMKSRAVLAFAENGLNLAVTLVMNLVNILAGCVGFRLNTFFTLWGGGSRDTARYRIANFGAKGLAIGLPYRN